MEKCNSVYRLKCMNLTKTLRELKKNNNVKSLQNNLIVTYVGMHANSFDNSLLA